MPCVVVNDASCLIDLRKGRLLHAMLRLPYRFVVPVPVRQDELLDFSPNEWRLLDDGGLETFDVPAERMGEAFAYKRLYPKLSANDCICLAAAGCFDRSILLTGDALLRRTAAEMGAEAHGVLWVVDALQAANACKPGVLAAALETWRDDPTVFLPEALISRRLRQLARD